MAITRDGRYNDVCITHYSSKHQILLVGEGDFSFSLSLATSFGSATNICASSLDSYDDVVRKYNKAKSNLIALKSLGASILHGVDATTLQRHPNLSFRRFDRIIFNFPHAGFLSKESDPYLIRKHRQLVEGFFHGASHMLSTNGEIHVSHKNKAPFCHWNLEELASRCCLVLIECVKFNKNSYPGYENKRGDGSRCDETFLLGDCSTFKFRFSRVAKELYAERMKRKKVKDREDVSIRAAQRTISPSLERDHVRFQDKSLLHMAKLRYTERGRGRGRRRRRRRRNQLRQDFSVQSIHHREDRFNGVSLEIYRGIARGMLTQSSFPYPYTGESRGWSHPCQKPFFECTTCFNGVTHEIYGRESLTCTSFPHMLSVVWLHSTSSTSFTTCR